MTGSKVRRNKRLKWLTFHVAGIICALCFAMLSGGAALAERRVALVIGNSVYQHAENLPNTINDADAIAAMLRAAGFDVVDERRNVTTIEFKRAVRDFMSSAINADIAVVYYSGHGIEIGGTNYLIPVDAKLVSDYDAEDEAIALDRIIVAAEPARRLRLIVLDACRDNPFLRSGARLLTVRKISKGLASIEPGGTDTLIAYAAKAGSVSEDGVGENSPFTAAVLKYLTEPGLDIRIAFGRVRDDVLAATASRQEPFVYGSLGGATISLIPAKAEATPVAPDPNAGILGDYLMAERIGTRQAWESFLAMHIKGYYADLARAQLAKLTGTDGAAAAAAGRPQPVVPNVGDTEDKKRPAIEQACKRDGERLAQLRVNPTRPEVQKLLREIGCEELRPQVARLLESLGGPPVPTVRVETPAVNPLPSALPSKGQKEQADPEQACKRDTERLAILRKNPTIAEAERFFRELNCEELRPQIARLLESLGAAAPTVGATATPPKPEPPAPDSGSKSRTVDEQTCRSEEDQLAQLRANPERQKILRFISGLHCEVLRPQAQRLLESIGG
jgi:uncharacterized caspase-like protein